MQNVTVEELINYKVLPFNLYTKGDKLLFPAGEVLTPGKFLQLRHINPIYRKKNEKPVQFTAQQDTIQPQIQQTTQEESQPVLPQKNIKLVPSIDDIDIRDLHMAINKKSQISAQDQLKIKCYFDQTMKFFGDITPREMSSRVKEVRDKINDGFSKAMDNATYSSEIRLLGEYDECHVINVSMLSAALARKLGKPEDFVADVTTAALLHDIGKICLPKELLTKTNLTSQEQKLFEAHTTIGYNLIKNKMNLDERIAKVALEHHERNDGTGYPNGKSGDLISLESQIIRVCNYFDNLAFNKTPVHIFNTRDALKQMLELGSSKFAAEILYTFVHMFSYNDTEYFENMITF